MKKVKTIIMMAFVLMTSVSYANNKEESYNLIVKFKDSIIHESMSNDSNPSF